MENYNWGIIGHQKISEFLQKSLDNDKISHAYLLAGPEHIGKSLMAKKFMATILCHDYHKNAKILADKIPCGQCVFCTQLAKGIHPDVYFLKKEEDKKNISVEQVREMQKFLSLTSFLNSYKIALIENAEQMSESAQNALLKVLEEPTKNTLIILLCPDSNLLLPTIVSRCQLVKFYPVSQDEISHHLISLGASREQARLYSTLANGQIGLAINFFQNPELFTAYLGQTEMFLSNFTANLVQKFSNLDNSLQDFKGNIEKNSYLLGELKLWESILRDILMCKQGLISFLANLHFQNSLEKIAARYSTLEIISFLNQLKQIKKYLTYNINPRLAVENLVLNF